MGMAALLIVSMLFSSSINLLGVVNSSNALILFYVGALFVAVALPFVFGNRKRAVFLFAVFLIILGISIVGSGVRYVAQADVEWWNTDWAYRQIGTIQHDKVASDLTYFPVLIDTTDSYLSSYAQADGDDIVFADQFGTLLDHEIELFDSANGHLIAWVRFPALSSTVDTVFHMYYGNPAASNMQNPRAVWDSSFLAVHHLEETSGNATDSTSNAKDAVATQVSGYNANGKVGNAFEFTRSSDRIQLPQVYSIETQFTFSAWIYAASGARYFISEWYNYRGAFLQVFSDKRVELYVNNVMVSKPISINEWHYVVATYDGVLASLYVDGGSPTSIAAPNLVWPSQSMYLGNRYDLGRAFKGRIDEVRFSNISRSAEWIATEYNNQKDPRSFCTFQHEDAALISEPSPAESASLVKPNPTLSIRVTDTSNHLMTVVFLGNSSGLWEELGIYVGGNGIYTQNTTAMNLFDTTYYWQACVLDSGSQVWVNQTFHFTTAKMLEFKWSADVPARASNQLHPVIGDINGDGRTEVVMSGDSIVVALNGADGTDLWRYPMGVHRAITLADLTNDGIPEILAMNGEGVGNDRVFALFGNGTLYWQSAILTGDRLCDFPVTAYDIDHDGYPTIYVATEDENSATRYGRLIALNHLGQVLMETPVYHPCTGGPTVADYDFDGVFEVYMGDRNYNWGMGMRSWWAENLTSRWNQTKVFCSSQVPTLVDFNKDGKLEVIALNVIDNGLAVLDASNGHIIQDDRRGGLPSHATPTVYDVDDDGNLEVILSYSRDGDPQNFVIWDLGRRAVDADISLAAYDSQCAWPPTVADVDGDGKMEIIAALGIEPGQGASGKDFPILIYEAVAANTYQLVAEIWESGAGCYTFARVQDIDNDGLNEVIVAGIEGKVFAFDTVAPTPSPRSRTGVPYYSEYRRGAAEYVESPGPSNPFLSGETPSNGTAGVPLNPKLSVDAHDFQHDLPMSVVFMSNFSGTWETLGTYSGGNGIYTQATTGMNSYNTTYFWAVDATDSVGHTTHKEYKFTTFTPPPWSTADWRYRKTIIINHTKVASDETNFPLLINVVDPNLASHARTTAEDIVFTDHLGTKLDHEIESYSSFTGHLVAWVSLKQLSSTDDLVIYMYYGNEYCSNQENPEAVWNSDFLAVHHLEEKSGAALDSTAKHNDALFTKVTTYGAAGQIGNAVEFAAVGDYIELPRVLSSEQRFTFSAWIYASSGAAYFISEWYAYNGAYLRIYNDNRLQFYIDGRLANSIPITINQWHFVAVSYDGTTSRLYLDDATPSSGVQAGPTWPTRNTFIGDRYDHVRRFRGFMDEVRISNISRSAAWIITEYNNQRDPSAFCVFGDEEYLNTPPTATEPLITPTNPLTTDGLVATYTYEDLDGDIESGTQIRWYNDGLLQTDLNDNPLVPAHLTKKGETWYFTVTPSDGMEFGSMVTSPSVTILNSPPVITSCTPEVATPTVNEGESLAFTHTSYDSDDDLLLYAWLLDSSEVAYTQDWTYSPDYDDAGYHNVTLTVSDGQELVAHEWSVTITDVNRPPSAPAIEITPTQPTTNDDLSCAVTSPSIDPDGDTITYEYEWYLDGAPQPDLTNSVVVPRELTSRGQTWTCVVTPSDGKDYGPPAEAYVTIQNAPPQIDTYTPENLSPSVNEGETLEFTHTSSDPDGDTLTYEWLLDSASQSADQNWTYTTDYYSSGDRNVTLVVSDGESTTTQYWLVTVIDVNQTPTIDSRYPETDPTIPEGQNQEFNITYSDIDGDVLTIEWWADEALMKTETGGSVSFYMFEAGVGSAGTHNITAIVKDGETQASHEWTLTVTEPPAPLLKALRIKLRKVL